ncbi:OprD family porin [Stutzerimonas tarimensis]|uniref:OprD family porin n=1 Tax=Stutzerimonas tarimensis TaxID=1507735 RepID=A0ABV7T9J3_9GAMM
MLTSVRRPCSPAPLALAVAIVAAGLAPLSQAAFLEDSNATLEARNVYFNRDFREGTGQSKREEWGQGFILNIQSGYTEGTIGVGLDALGMLGLKLDSSPDRAGSGVLPVGDSGRAADEYSKLGLTGKLKWSETELRLGTLIPELPTLAPNDGRLLPQSFEGGLLVSQDIEGLTLTGGRIDRTKQRDSTHAERLALNNKNSRFAVKAEADHLTMLGFDYRISETLTGRYHVAELEDVYRQHFFGLLVAKPAGSGTLSADLRFSISDDQGASNAGQIDNRALNGLIGYSLAGHKVSLGYQHLSGDTGFAYVDGTNPFLVNFVQINDFANAEQRSWQARYDYNFAAVGIPGLSFMTRYISGDNARITGSDARGDEWERNIELRYVLQDGPLKNLGVRLRHASFRSDFARDADETRVIVSYTKPIW